MGIVMFLQKKNWNLPRNKELLFQKVNSSFAELFFIRGIFTSSLNSLCIYIKENDLDNVNMWKNRIIVNVSG